MSLLSDDQRCDAWELGVQVATLQARGVRELHSVIANAKDELAKQTFLVLEELNSFKNDVSEKMMQMSGEVKLLKAEVSTQNNKVKDLEENLEREREVNRELTQRVSNLEQMTESVFVGLKNETAARQGFEGSMEKRMSEAECEIWEMKKMDSQLRSDIKARNQDMEEWIKTVLLESQFTERINEISSTLREYSIAQDKETRMIITKQGAELQSVSDQLWSMEQKLRGDMSSMSAELLQDLGSRLQETLRQQVEEVRAATQVDCQEVGLRASTLAAEMRANWSQADGQLAAQDKTQKDLLEKARVGQQQQQDMLGGINLLREELDKMKVDGGVQAVLLQEAETEIKRLEFLRKSDPNIVKVDHLEMFELETNKKMKVLEERTFRMEKVDLASFDSRLREEVQHREQLEHRCRYLPKE